MGNIIEIFFLTLGASFVQRTTGFGFGIFIMTLLPFLMPSYGEEARRGFYMRGLGYYFTLSDYMDLALTGGFYTLGSWEAQAVSRYVKKYKN